MNREFLDFYNRELDVLYEHAREFADEYPGIAGRLGGLLRERMDPTVAGLLEGAAFLAARVQLKLKHEFPEFINNLLEQLVPHFLAPTPSMMLVKIAPLFGDPELREGRKVERGSLLDAVYIERDRHVSCRYRLTTPICLWPFDLTGAEYYTNSAPLHALGIRAGRDIQAGMRLSLNIRTAASPENEISQSESRKAPDTWFSATRITHLPIYLAGTESDAVALYEQIFAYCNGIWFRYFDDFGNPVVVSAPTDCVVQVGFDDAEALMPNDNRMFRGFDLLREYFAFPRKFLAFDLVGLDSIMQKLLGNSIDIVFGFNEVNAHLAAAVRPNMFALYAAPAINLFEMTTDRVPIRKNQHEFHVVPDRSRYLDFEPHRVLEVYANISAAVEKIPVRPLYSAYMDSQKSGGLYYTIRRVPRRRTIEEKSHGLASNYIGTDVFISLGEPATLEDSSSITELSIRALCSNRHLTEHLPVSEGHSDFQFADDVSLRVLCVAGPTPPREPIVAQLRSRTETAHTGVVAWRLLSLLRLNHLGLVERGAGNNARALREILATFADLSDSAIERRLRGILSLESRPVVRRLRRQGGIGPARGIEITLTLDDKAFEGSGAFLLGAVLDRFFCEYAAFNNFTQLVVRTSERGEIMRWPARIGVGRPL
jgi:type VI secretion system protein ImpG